MLNRNNPDYWCRFWGIHQYGLDFDPFWALLFLYNQYERRESIYTKYRHIYGGALYD